MLVHELLRHSTARQPEGTALIAGNRRLTFREVDDLSDRLAAALQRLGAARGDRVAAMLENSVEFVITLWAALKAGAVFVPVNHAARGGTLGLILQDAEVKCLVIQPQYRQRFTEAVDRAPERMAVIWTGAAESGERFEDILAARQEPFTAPRVIDQDLALLIYTSGTTGGPKGVMLTHHTVCNNAWAIATYLGMVPGDVVLCVLPMSFGYGLFQVLTAAQTGFAVVLERSFAFPREVLRQAAHHRVTAIPGVPSLFARFLDFAPFTDFDLSALRILTNAAAPMPPTHIERLRAALPQAAFYSMYGLTECTRAAYLDPTKLTVKPASVGRAIPNSEIFVVDEDGQRLPPGEVGELVVRGSNLMRGYWRRPEDTARVLRDGPDGGKLLHTGDLFYTDADGDLFFAGRRDDVFKCRGEKVSPRAVENALHECDDIAEAVVVGVPDPVDGMAVKAVVVLREGREMTAEALRRYCMTRLETWLVPKFIEFRDELPKTDSGKVKRRALREPEVEAT